MKLKFLRPKILYKGKYHLTVLHTGIVVGSKSSSFKIIRDLCKKPLLIIATQYPKTRIHPITICGIITFL